MTDVCVHVHVAVTGRKRVAAITKDCTVDPHISEGNGTDPTSYNYAKNSDMKKYLL